MSKEKNKLRGLSLSQKLVFAFVGFILVFAVANLVAASRVVDQRVRTELQTSELSFARSLATRLFPQIRDKDSLHVTEALLDEMSMREDKLEYLVIYDRDGKLLAHTYLAPLPAEVKVLRNDFTGKEAEGRTSRVTGASIDAFDVAVPVLEGINQVGSVHVGIRAAYLDKVKSDLIRLLAIVAGVTFVLAAVLAFVLARIGLRPVQALVGGIRALERGDRARVIVKGHDELAMLAAAFNEMGDRIGEREDALKQAYSKVRLVLDNTGDGLLTTHVADGSCDETVSKAMNTWFGEYRGQPVWEYLFPEDKTMQDVMRMGLQECVDGFMPAEVLLAQLPSKIVRGDRRYRVAYRPIGSADEISKLLVVVNDVTEELAQARAQAEAAEKQAILIAFAQDRDGATRSFGECRAIVEALRSERSELVQKRLIHTLKGNCAILGLGSVATVCHGVEEELADEVAFSREHVDQISAAWGRIDGEVARSFPNLDESRIEIDLAEYTGLVDKVARSTGATALMPAIEAMRNTPANSVFRAMARSTEQLATRLGKSAKVDIDAHGVRVDMQITSDFWSSLVHVIRNAIDHGLETPEERVALGKPETGAVRLASDIVDGALRVTIADDGRGIDWDRIRERAIALGLAYETHDDLVAAIFVDGLSTRDQATELSGRGVGMAAVLSAVRMLGGEIFVLSELGRGTTFHFDIPIQLGTTRSQRRAGRVVTLVPNAA